MKIIEIKNCRDCPYLKQFIECGKTRMTVNEFPIIPHWCPLEEYQIENFKKGKNV